MDNYKNQLASVLEEYSNVMYNAGVRVHYRAPRLVNDYER